MLEKGEPQHVSGTAWSTTDQIKAEINKSFIDHKSTGAPVIFLASLSALMRLLTFAVRKRILHPTTQFYCALHLGKMEPVPSYKPA